MFNKKILLTSAFVIATATPIVATTACSMKIFQRKMTIDEYFHKYAKSTGSDPISTITMGNAIGLRGESSVPSIATSYAEEFFDRNLHRISIGGSLPIKDLSNEKGNLAFISVDFNAHFSDKDMHIAKEYVKRVSSQISHTITSPTIIAIRLSQELGDYKDKDGFYYPLGLNTTAQVYYSLYGFVNGAAEIWNKTLTNDGKDLYGNPAEDNKLFWYPEPNIVHIIKTMKDFNIPIPFTVDKF